MDCLSGLTDSLKNKDKAQEESREKFDEQITRPFKQLQDSQREHMKSLPVQQEHHKNNISRQWRKLKRSLMSERSPWGSKYVVVAAVFVVVVKEQFSIKCRKTKAKIITLSNRSDANDPMNQSDHKVKKVHVAGAKRGKTRACKSRSVLILLLIG